MILRRRHGRTPGSTFASSTTTRPTSQSRAINGTACRSASTSANAVGKPLLVGELGVKPSDVRRARSRPARTSSRGSFARSSARASPGILLWAWDKNGSLLDNYDIGPNDPVLGILRSLVRSQPHLRGRQPDGIVDSLQPPGTPAAAFVDNAVTPSTTGSVTNANGLAVRITDAPVTDGVEISVGSGSGTVELSVCGGFVLRLTAGSRAVVTCGSVTVSHVTGQAQVVLGGGVQHRHDGQRRRSPESLRPAPAGPRREPGTPRTLPLLWTEHRPRCHPNHRRRTWRRGTSSALQQPVDNAGVLNSAKAGRAIPLKWQILDARSNPVDDPHEGDRNRTDAQLLVGNDDGQFGGIRSR